MIPYDDNLRQRIATNLAVHERTTQSLEGLRHAAVAIVIIDSEKEPNRPGSSQPKD